MTTSGLAMILQQNSSWFVASSINSTDIQVFMPCINFVIPSLQMRSL
jgi:hypothetical protein